MNKQVPVTNAQDVVMGRVKWFNNKSGFGFITVTDGENPGSDIFVHHSAIKVDSEQYKYLVQGEYVEFTLVDTPDSKHTCQASNVSGIKGGKLMCETRREFRVARNNYHGPDAADEDSRPQQPRTQNVAKARGSGPRDEGAWSYVAKGKKQSSSSAAQPKPRAKRVEMNLG